MRNHLAFSWEKGAKTDIIGSLPFCLQCFFPVMSRFANYFAGSEQFTGFANFTIILPEMDAVSTQLMCKPKIVVDDKSRTKTGREPL